MVSLVLTASSVSLFFFFSETVKSRLLSANRTFTLIKPNMVVVGVEMLWCVKVNFNESTHKGVN